MVWGVPSARMPYHSSWPSWMGSLSHLTGPSSDQTGSTVRLGRSNHCNQNIEHIQLGSVTDTKLGIWPVYMAWGDRRPRVSLGQGAESHILPDDDSIRGAWTGFKPGRCPFGPLGHLAVGPPLGWASGMFHAPRARVSANDGVYGQIGMYGEATGWQLKVIH
jgi:hypothetical protein